jgi:hypothetical protein
MSVMLNISTLPTESLLSSYISLTSKHNLSIHTSVATLLWNFAHPRFYFIFSV